MKKKVLFFGLLMTVMVVLMAMLSISASAETEGDYTYEVENGVVTITKYVGFETDIVIPSKLGGKNVIAIGDSAFTWCESMTSVYIPDTVRSLGIHSFSNCTKLTEIFIPNSVTSIGRHAFYNCDNLKKAIVGSGVSVLPNACFRDCESLKMVYLHSSLIEIHKPESFGKTVEAFEGCYNLTDIYYQGDDDAWDKITGKDQFVFTESYLTKGATVHYDITSIPFGLDDNEFRIPDVPFPGVGQKWFSEAVYYCVDNGYIAGTDKGTFNPDGNLTREQFVIILARVAGADLSKYTVSPFADVKATSWYGPQVIWAASEGYVNGVGDGKSFGVGQNMTREQLAAMFYRYAQKQGVDVSGKADLGRYKDVSSISSWAKDACSWAVDSGIIKGTSDTTISPKMTVTRAQAAQIFMNYDSKVAV